MRILIKKSQNVLQKICFTSILQANKYKIKKNKKEKNKCENILKIICD